jgi:hypothetical protein
MKRKGDEGGRGRRAAPGDQPSMRTQKAPSRKAAVATPTRTSIQSAMAESMQSRGTRAQACKPGRWPLDLDASMLRTRASRSCKRHLH